MYLYWILLSVFAIGNPIDSSGEVKYQLPDCIPYLSLSWSQSQPDINEIEFNATYETEPGNWVGIGLSPDGSMLHSRALVALVHDDSTVTMAEYQVVGYGERRNVLQIDKENATNFGTNAVYDAQTGRLNFSFKRTIQPRENLDVIPIYLNVTENYVMCASGMVVNRQLKYHFGNRNVSPQVFL